ncbi:hypothetical protein ACC676_39790, partial [Rhizobium ruizarguesonis]
NGATGGNGIGLVEGLASQLLSYQANKPILDDVFDLDPSDIWEETQRTLPELLAEIDGVRNWHAQGE